MKILDRYILRKFLGTFIYAMLIMGLIACVIDYSQKVEDFVRTKPSFGAVMAYYGVFIPHITALLFPFFTFIAAIFFTSRLAYRTEIIVMLATGMSFNRLLRPYFIGGLFLMSVSILGNHYLIPVANKYRIRFEHQYYRNKVTRSDQNLHMQLTPSLLVYVHDYNYTTNSGTYFTAETVEGTRLKEKIFAESFSYDEKLKVWKLKNVFVRTNDSLDETLQKLPELSRSYPISPKDLKVRDDIKETLTTPELNEYMAVQGLRGNKNLSIFAVEKDRRSAQPFASLVLTIMAGCIASRKIRGGSGLHLVIGIVICVLYEMARQFSTTLAINTGFSSLIAVWIPNIIFAGLAFYLYRQKVK